MEIQALKKLMEANKEMEIKILSEKLMKAIGKHDLGAVQKYLGKGADPNYRRFKDEDEPNGYIQPTTPLRLVMFCISDSLLTQDGLDQHRGIAELLLSYGADPHPAMEIAEWRYGKYDPTETGKIMGIWHIVGRAFSDYQKND